MNEDLTRYKTVYDSFVDGFRKGIVGPEDIGIKIIELGKERLKLNLLKVEVNRSYRAKMAEICNAKDADGKAMAFNKAEITAKATPEAFAMDEIETHCDSCKDAIFYCHDLIEAIGIEKTNP